MPRKSTHAHKKDDAIKLRLAKRMGTKQIARRLSVPVATIHYWLRDHPLTKAEISKIISKSPRYVPPRKKLSIGEGFPCDPAEMLGTRELGAIGETAIQFRLALNGLVMASPVGDGDVVDLYVRRRNGQKMAFIQIRVASKPKSRNGLPSISLRRACKGKSRRLGPSDFHFIVGYCLLNQTAYVYSQEEVAHLVNSVTVRDDAKEAWWKILEWLDADVETVRTAGKVRKAA